MNDMKTCFHGGASFDAIGSDFDRLESKSKVIRADVIDAWYDPAPNVVEALEKNLKWLLRNSAPTNSEGLIKTISKVRGIPPENLLVGGGSSDLMFAFFLHYPFDSVTILDPMYGEYAHIFEKVLKKIPQRVLQRPKDCFKISTDDILQGSAGSDMIVIVNPNSPTGQYLTKDEVQKLLLALPKKTTLVIDETYIDFVGKDQSVEGLVPEHKNLVIIKSMSKVYALSGARVGYLAAHSDIIEQIRGHIPPWSVGLIGQVAGVEALKNEEYYEKRIAETHQLRENFATQLKEIPGITVYPSCTNFILLDISNTGKNSKQIYEELIKQNIYVRDVTSMGVQFDHNFIRIAVKDGQSNDKICSALKNILKRTYEKSDTF
ncbi:histidinol-phosphate aminotransferase family protein [Candidatus Woesearchaeota archaeon]|nr:histidinol-phosphate aminotransferase family protein [Candidatus Woesearchaeota archaeon]